MNTQSPPQAHTDTKLTQIQETALTLFHNGYHPVRLEWSKKTPGHNGWQDKVITEDTIIRDFSRRSNIGLLQGVMGPDKTFPLTIDIDVDNGAVVSYVEATIGSDCPKKRGKKGMSFLVRAVGDVKSRSIHLYHGGKKVPAGDILAKGKQTVIPPSIHPDTQLPYQWCGVLNPLNTKYESLPLVDECVIDEIVAYCRDADNPIARLNDLTWKGVGGGGDTHDGCVAAVGSMVSRGWPDEQIHARIRRAKREACERAGEAYHWPEEAKKCKEWIDSARDKDFGTKKSKAKPSHGDLANLVLSQHGRNVRRDKATRDWCVYNGKFWEEGATEEVKTLIKECLTDDQIFRSVIDGVEAVLRLARPIAVKTDIWNKNRNYLNCPDGTYNLKTRERMPHDPGHYITRMTRVSPRFDYQDTRWVKELPTWFGSNPEELYYIQVLLGMFLTGEIRDHCVAMWLGLGGSGKSRAPEIMLHIMGDYAQVATDTAFLDVKYHPHNEEIARMRGKRLVIINEVEGNLNLQRVKAISAGESTSASFKGKDSIEFAPEAKLWFIGNEPPPTKSSGSELQRRFHVFDFLNKILNRDGNMKEILEAEAEYIMGWAIDGAVEYYKQGGLKKSPHVVESTKRYFSDADIMEQWIEDHCIVDPLAVTPVNILFDNFDPWCDEAGVRFKPDKGRFSQRLKAKGYKLDRQTVFRGKPAVRVIVGLRLRTDEELPFRGVVIEGDPY